MKGEMGARNERVGGKEPGHAGRSGWKHGGIVTDARKAPRHAGRGGAKYAGGKRDNALLAH
jgi:hypothetical protein